MKITTACTFPLSTGVIVQKIAPKKGPGQKIVQLGAVDPTIKQWAGYNRKRPQDEGQFTLVDCFSATQRGCIAHPE